MSESQRRPEPAPKIAPEFRDMEHFKAEINDVGYARYNYKELLDREAKLKEMIEGAADVALFNSGAAAMHSALEAEGLKAGDVIFCANAIYGTTKADIQGLEKLGVRVVLFDSTNSDALEKLVAKERPRLIVVESVANAKKMEVTDIGRLGEIASKANALYQQEFAPAKVLTTYLGTREKFSRVSQETQELLLGSIEEFRQGQNPFVFRDAIKQIESEAGLSRKDAIREVERIVKRVIGDSREKLSLIIDNTLPSPQLLNPLRTLKDTKTEKIIIESGTKHYQAGANEITLGLAYSDNPEKMQAIKSRRIELGTYLQPTNERKIPSTITETMPITMENHARNALHLAKALGGVPGFEVSHPNLPEHAQHELAGRLAPEGLVTLFYITVPETMTGEEFMERVKAGAGDSVGLGSSFGHAKTWLSNYGLDNRTVRIAAGSESEADFEQIVQAVEKVAKGDKG